MAIVVNNPGTTAPADRDSGSSAAGWIVALLIALAVIAGLVYWYRARAVPAASTGNDNTPLNINITAPTPSGGSGDAGAGSGNTAPSPAQ